MSAAGKSIAQEVSPGTRELSQYIAGAVRKPLPKEVMERARIHLVDTFAAMISGSRLLPGRLASAHAASLGGRKEAGVIGTRVRASATDAALANGMLAHADESDDTHPPSITHPGASVLPAALAIGERDHLPGKAVLRAMVAGYEVCARVPMSMQPTQFLRSGHQEGAIGQLFGAATAAAALLKLDALRVRYVMSYAAQQASGLATMFRDTEHVEKAFGMGGMPARNGVAAALMVASGFTGVEDPFTGDRDFYLAFRKSSEPPRRELLSQGLGTEFEIMRGGIKRWTTGGGTQGALHVLHALIVRHGIRAQDVAQVRGALSDRDFEVVSNRDMPDICVQHLMAIMLLDGTVSFRAAHDDALMHDPRVLDIRSRIHMVGDPELADPLRRWRCRMEVELRDGRVLQGSTMAAKGTFENPLNRDEEEDKAVDLIAPVLGSRRCRALLDALWQFDRLEDVASLRKLYAAAG